MKALTFLPVALSLFLTTLTAQARTLVYSIHVGVNAPPSGSVLPVLRYADDDAARFHSFVSSFAAGSTLLTVLDADSQRRFPEEASQSVAPSVAALESAVARLRVQFRADEAAGNQVVLYFSYSGHGVAEGSSTRLSLLDGFIDGSWLEQNILTLPAQSIHLFIDSCHAEGLVFSRGPVRGEVSAESVALSEQARSNVVRSSLLDRYPNVGVVLASTVDREAHEWSQLQAGVFTHELLSALAGAADVNMDGEVAYSEVAAFMAAANRDVIDPRAAPQVVALAPRINLNTPILALGWMRQPAMLQGQASSLGHFYVESERGVRRLDAHAERGTTLRVMVPVGERIWIRTGVREASLVVPAGGRIALASLEWRPSPQVARGSIGETLQRSLFSTPFGPAYYRGWVDQRGDVSVPFDAVAEEDKVAEPSSKTASTLCFVGAGVGLGLTATFGVLAVQAKSDYDSTNLQRPAQEAWDRMSRYRTLAIGSGVVGVGLGVTGILLWPKEQVSVGAGPGDRAGVSFGGVW